MKNRAPPTQDLAYKLLKVGKGYGYNLLPIVYPSQQQAFEKYLADNYLNFNSSVQGFVNGTARLKAWRSASSADCGPKSTREMDESVCVGARS